jgi:flagellar biosynthesis activator protein FlaF
MSLKAYQKAAGTAEDPRLTEYRLFGDVTRALIEAQKADLYDYRTKVDALDWNRRLWSVLGVDCASDDNKLPTEVRASIVSLSIWVSKHTSLVMRGEGEIEDLIEINRMIMAGLGAGARNDMAAASGDQARTA